MQYRKFGNTGVNISALGFGCMRLPMVNGEVDTEEFKRMVDHFLEKGFNYFDTAHGYLDGKSETALKACLTSRYPRESYVLTDKLSGHHFETEADIYYIPRCLEFDDVYEVLKKRIKR